MNRAELVKAVAAHVGLDPGVVDTALQGTIEVIEAVTARGEEVTISRFARFASVERSARIIRNPATGGALEVKASKRPKITALKGFKDAVLNPAEAPKLAEGVWPVSKAGPKWPEAKESPGAARAGQPLPSER